MAAILPSAAILSWAAILEWDMEAADILDIPAMQLHLEAATAMMNRKTSMTGNF